MGNFKIYYFKCQTLLNKISSYNKETKILKKGLQTELVANNTVMPDELEKMIKEQEKLKEKKEKLI